MKKKKQVLIDYDELLSIGAAIIRSNQQRIPLTKLSKASGLARKRFYEQFEKEELA